MVHSEGGVVVRDELTFPLIGPYHDCARMRHSRGKSSRCLQTASRGFVLRQLITLFWNLSLAVVRHFGHTTQDERLEEGWASDGREDEVLACSGAPGARA